MSKKRGKKLTEVGKGVPSNFKFGLLVTVAIFWTEFIKNIMAYIVEHYFADKNPMLVSFLTAVFFTALAYLILNDYFKIREKLKKIEF